MNAHIEREATAKRRPSVMMRVRQRLYPHRRYLKWLRHIARLQMRLQVNYDYQWRFCRWVSLLTTDPDEEVLWHIPGTSLRFSLDLLDVVQAYIYFRNITYQPEIAQAIERWLRLDRLFVDVGANIGINCIFAASYYQQCFGATMEPMVWAFEPNPYAYVRLQRNVKLNGLENLVRVSDVAISDHGGVATFYLCDNNSVVSSLAPNRFTSGRAISVNTMSLDNFFQGVVRRPIGLIKMDIEGGELLALQGASSLLSRDRPILIIEVNPELMQPFGYTYDDLKTFLTKLEYSITVLPKEDVILAKSIQSSDILCLPKELK